MYGPPSAYGQNQYGAMPAYDQGYPAKSPFMRGQRRHFNLPAILLSFFVPWLLFTALSAEITFSIHYNSVYEQDGIHSVILLVSIIFVLFFGYLAYVAYRKKAEGEGEPTWYIFLFATAVLAWAAAYIYGNANYRLNMEPYYDAINLNVYPLVDPQQVVGQQLMDVGMVQFTPSTRLDLTKSMGFKDDRLYCVAPIISGNGTMAHNRYDLWAVGLDCCSGHAADFACGEFNNPMAHSGLRLVQENLRPYFRLAVQQAEAAYNIYSIHTVFMYFLQDPLGELNAYQDAGYKKYMTGVMGYFAVQLLLVVLATVVFSKLGHM